MEFDNLSFNWRSAGHSEGSKTEIEVLSEDGSAVATLVPPRGIYLEASSFQFIYNLGFNKFASAKLDDDLVAFWWISLDEGTIEKIPPSSISVDIVTMDSDLEEGFHWRNWRGTPRVTVGIENSIEDLFQELNSLRGKPQVWITTNGAEQLTDLDSQIAQLQFSDSRLNTKYNYGVSREGSYVDQGPSSLGFKVVY